MKPEQLKIGEVIGHGGMATVYRAVEQESGRVVALKQVHDHLRHDPSVRARFLREVEIARALSHPNIIRIFEVIEEPLSFTMEYGGERDLKDVIRERAPMAAGEIEAIAGQVLSALGAAHLAGVIHRDVKPQNILVDNEGRIKLLDFGLARAQGMASLTTKSMIIGTPDYIAPEVIRDTHPDPRSDLYSLGVILFEMATGALPFSGNAPLQIIQRRLETPAPDPASLRADLPANLAAVINRALERDPSDRFQTAEEMAQALTAPGAAPVRSGGTGEDRCPSCQALIAAEYPVCLECGDETLAKVERGASMVLLTRRSDDAKAAAELDRLLARLSAGKPPRKKGKASPRRPLLLVKNVTGLYADYLVRKLRALGHQSEVRDMSQPSSELLSPVEKAGFVLVFLGLYLGIFTLAMGMGRMDIFTWLFGFAFGLVLMFGFEYWFSRRVPRLYPALVREIARAPAPFPQGIMDGLLQSVRGSSSRKVKRDLQKVFRAGVALRGRLQANTELAETVGKDQVELVDSLFAMTLGLVAEINRIDGETQKHDEAAVSEQIQALSRQADKTTDPETRRLVLAQLQDREEIFRMLLDYEKKRELLYARLLQVCSRIELLLRSMLAAEADATAQGQAEISMTLKRLSTEVEAVVRTSREMDPVRS